jgi:hypothetical protein
VLIKIDEWGWMTMMMNAGMQGCAKGNRRFPLLHGEERMRSKYVLRSH